MKLIKKGYRNYCHSDLAFFISIKGKKLRNSWGNLDESGNLYISKGYISDGPSPCIEILGLIFGIPQGSLIHTGYPSSFRATTVHDWFYIQSRQCNDLGISRKDVDTVFLDLLRQDKFFLFRLYYWLVRILGWFFWNRNKSKEISLETIQCNRRQKYDFYK